MARGRRSETRDGEGRRARRLLGGADYRMSVPQSIKEPGYEYRWFNDSRGRLEAAEEADWEFVEADGRVQIGTGAESNAEDGARVSMTVGTHENGSGARAYLMRKKREWHEEDQREKQSRIDAVEAQIRNRETPGGGGVERDKTYGDVRISHG